MVQKKIKKVKMPEKHNGKDPDETETEDSGSDDDDDDDYADAKMSKQIGRKNKGDGAKNIEARKSKPTKPKKKLKTKKNNSEEDLIAAIRNKKGRGNPLASIAARYGVSSTDDDPLDDAKFKKLRSKYSKK